MDIDFIKMHGAGNDYVYIDMIRHHQNPDYNRLDFNDLAEKISSRHFGVGGDGLVLIMPSETADFRMRMFNADGSEAEMCGNAIRCVGKYLYDRKYIEADSMGIETAVGIKRLRIIEKDDSGKAVKLKVDMGLPILDGKDIPVSVDSNPVTGIEVEGYRGTAVSMGNPHFVTFVDEITDKMVLNDGPKIEINPIFPRKANVEFVKVLAPDRIRMRVWERGTGETLACGTGACAAVVASVLNNHTSRKVSVMLPGGTLEIEWDDADNRVYMTGPAEEVFTGTYFYCCGQ